MDPGIPQIISYQTEVNAELPADFRPTLKIPYVITSLPADYVDDALRLLRSDPELAFEPWEEKLLTEVVLDPKKNPSILVLSALDREGNLAGVTVATLGMRARIDHTIIDPAYRGEGLLHALEDTVQQIAVERGIYRATLTVTANNNDLTKARGAWERVGFKKQAGEATLEKDYPQGIALSVTDDLKLA